MYTDDGEYYIEEKDKRKSIVITRKSIKRAILLYIILAIITVAVFIVFNFAGLAVLLIIYAILWIISAIYLHKRVASVKYIL